MKGLKTALILSALALTTACEKKEPPHTTSAVGVLNVRQIIQDSPVVADINKALTAKIQPLQTALKEKQTKLEQDASTLNTPGMTPEAAQTLRNKIIEGKKELITEAGQLRQENQNAQTEALTTVYAKLDKSIANYNASQGGQYKLILKRTYVLYMNENLNITKQVQADFDKASA